MESSQIMNCPFRHFHHFRLRPNIIRTKGSSPRVFAPVVQPITPPALRTQKIRQQSTQLHNQFHGRHHDTAIATIGKQTRVTKLSHPAMVGENTLNTQEIERLQQIACSPQQSIIAETTASNNSPSVPQDNAQRPASSSNIKTTETQSQISESGEQPFPYLTDSIAYHADRLNRSSSLISDLSFSASIEVLGQSTIIARQGGDESPFKVPSFPSISSILKPTRSSDENDSSLQGLGEDSPRLSQFFHPTQESPPHVHSSPHPPEALDQTTLNPLTPVPAQRRVSTYTRLAVLEEQQRKRAEEEAAAAEARLRCEEDSFTTVPDNLRRKWAREEKAHQLFEGLRNIPVNVAEGRKFLGSHIDDLLFGTKTRLDPDGVRRVVRPSKTVSEPGSEDESDMNDSRRRASTAPARDKRHSEETVISNSQPSNGSHHETNGSRIRETPIDSLPNSPPPSKSAAIDSSQFLETWRDPTDVATPLRPPKINYIPSSTQSIARLAMETPAAKPPPQDSGESVPETSPVKATPEKDDDTQTGEFRTAFAIVDSSPAPVVPGRRPPPNVFVASSIPTDMSQRKRERPPRIRDDGSEDELPSKLVSEPKRKRRHVASFQNTEQDLSPSLAGTENDGESHRVLAWFKDTTRNYFPATVLEPPAIVSSDQPVPEDTEVLVRFDDGNEALVQLRHIRRFHLVEGDTIKVWMKRHTYIVCRVEYDPSEQGGVDILNNNIVVVTQKKPGATEELRFPIDKVYLTGSLLPQLNERKYLFTTSSRFLRGPSRQESSSPYIVRGPARVSGTLFQNMVFAISISQQHVKSNTKESGMKDSLIQAITSNCGGVVKDGLHEIFHFPTDVDGELVLQPQFSSTTFCAVIADGYSRKPKYLQALALGVPCLAPRWIEGCIKQNRIVDWRIYLLPAGDSTFLGGVKSMIVDPFPMQELLSSRLVRRNMPLIDQKILVITGKGKSKDDPKRHYHFILHALGSREVYRCGALLEADQFLSQGGFTMIIADEGEIKQWEGPPMIKLQSFEWVVQTLILGCFPDEL